MDFTNEWITQNQLSGLTRDETNDGYNECLGLWKNARDLALSERIMLLGNLMSLWYHTRDLFGNAPGPDPRGPAPPENHWYCCNSLRWVK